MNRTHIKRTLLIGVAVVVTAGLSAGAYLNSRRSASVDIATAGLTRGDVVVTINATGALEAVTTVQVGSQVSGTVRELRADFNSIVRKNQVLARLDPSLLQAQVEQQRASVVMAEANVERLKVARDDAAATLARTKALAGRQIVATADLTAAEVDLRSAEAQLKSAVAQLQQARASLNQAQVNVEKTVITSPIDGIVVSRDVDVGQTVAASMQAPTLFQIAADLSRMRLNASIDESDVGQIRPGQAVRFRVDAFPKEEFTGTVTQVRLSPTVVQNVVSYQTMIDVPNPGFKLRPGMTANATVEVARHDNVLRVANAAVRFRPQAETFAALGQPVPDLVRQAGTGNQPAAKVVRVADTAGGKAASAPAATVAKGQPGGASLALPAANAVFGGEDSAETPGRLWVMQDGTLTPIDVKLGLSDGTFTEVKTARLAEGAEVVTGVTTASAGTKQITAPASNPFLGVGPRMPMGGPPMGMRPGG